MFNRSNRTSPRLAAAIAALAAASIVSVSSCAAQAVVARSGELLVRVSPGKEWLHRYSAFKENPPQFAIWAEDEHGDFAGTVFATRKVATGKWAFSGGNPRKEALPVWKHRKEGSLLDSVTGATPKGSFSVAISMREGAAERRFYLYAEFNHSTDFNAAYPKGAREGEAGYSGGSGGSGQPSVLYRALVDLDSPADRFDFDLVGHGSPDGSDGAIYADLSALTTALGIVASVEARVAR